MLKFCHAEFSIIIFSPDQSFSLLMGSFAASGHMVQNLPSYALGHQKANLSWWSRFVLNVPVDSLLSSMADFVPCDR